jgi:YbbR domain-containing protein
MNALRFFTKHPGLKIVSLILAIILWLFVKSETGGEVAMAVPLEFYDLSPELIVTRISEEAINVRVNGSYSQLERLASKDVRVRISLSDVKPGINSFDIQPRNIPVAQGLAISQISPSSIKVELDQVMDKIVRIKAAVRGRPAEGYRMARTTVDPRYIKLRGARGQLRALNEISTEEIDISGLKETIRLEIPLKLAGLNLKRGVDRRVHVTVEIEEKAKSLPQQQ